MQALKDGTKVLNKEELRALAIQLEKAREMLAGQNQVLESFKLMNSNRVEELRQLRAQVGVFEDESDWLHAARQEAGDKADHFERALIWYKESKGVDVMGAYLKEIDAEENDEDYE